MGADIDARVANSKALLIDDIHLMALSDQNKEVLARVFKSFFDRKAQVVITSLYPPRSLGALEEALKFSFSKGWSVDLKMPSPTIQKDLISAASDRTGTGLSDVELGLLHEKLSTWGYNDLTVWLKRLTVYKKVHEASGRAVTLEDMLKLIYEPVLAGATEPPNTAGATFNPPPAPAKAESIAVIVPKGQDGLGAFAAAQFYDAGAQERLHSDISSRPVGNLRSGRALRHPLHDRRDMPPSGRHARVDRGPDAGLAVGAALGRVLPRDAAHPRELRRRVGLHSVQRPASSRRTT